MALRFLVGYHQIQLSLKRPNQPGRLIVGLSESISMGRRTYSIDDDPAFFRIFGMLFVQVVRHHHVVNVSPLKIVNGYLSDYRENGPAQIALYLSFALRIVHPTISPPSDLHPIGGGIAECVGASRSLSFGLSLFPLNACFFLQRIDAGPQCIQILPGPVSSFLNAAFRIG